MSSKLNFILDLFNFSSKQKYNNVTQYNYSYGIKMSFEVARDGIRTVII